MTSTDSAPALQAQYTNPSTTAPSEPFTLTQTLPATPSSSSSSGPPTAYLRALRDAVTQTQAQINEALTSRMDEDKRRDAEVALAAGGAAAAGPGGKSNKRKKVKAEIDEEAEEQNYGEEVVDED
ncbi:hypothetical protein KJ359_002470 [Pestalotiopsis sp. 9143b]|nr:hypothetical protein KJ359_002470 [Pestalotiopsis sp. 9143b]